MEVALAALRLGAGRAKAEDPIDPAVGVADLLKVGERIEAGSRLCTIHANDESALAETKVKLSAAIKLSDEVVPAPKLIGEIIG
jgi:thymidine phosphorylase